MPPIRLVFEKGRLQGQSFVLKEGEHLTCGRSARSDRQIPDNGVSRLHCRFENNPDGLTVFDLDSSNGTFVNGEEIKERRLGPEDRVLLGEALLRMEAVESGEEDSGPAPAPRSDSLRTTTLHLVNDEAKETLHAALRKHYRKDSEVIAAREGISTESEARTRRRLNALCQMANTIFTELSVDAIIDGVMRAAVETTGAERAALLLLDAEHKKLEPVAMRNLAAAPGQENVAFDVSRTILQETLRKGVSVLCADVHSDDRFAPGSSLVMQGIKTVMCVPLRDDEKILGVIYVDASSIASMFTEADLSILAAVGQQAGAAVERARLIHDLEHLFVGAMHTLVASIEAKDAYTRGHSERVTHYALLLADEMKWGTSDRDVLELGGLLHDVGKIGVPEAILLKPAKLDGEERSEIEKHPEQGVRIIENMPEMGRMVSMHGVTQAVLHHHERYDGGGYPNGVRGDAIPLASRVLAIADTFDAITSDRPYRKGRTREVAIDIIRKEAGKQFDPSLVKSFVEIYNRGDLAREPAEGSTSRTATRRAMSQRRIRNAS